MKSTFQIFRDAIEKILNNPKTFLSIAALPTLLAIGVALLEPEVDLQGNYMWESTAQTIQYFVAVFLFSIASLFMTVALMHATSDTTLSAMNAYKQSTKKVLPYFLLMIVSSLVLMVAFLLLIIPGIWLSVCFLFSAYYLVLRNTGIKESLKMSYGLVKGRWWKVFGKMLMFALLYVLLAIAVYILLWFVGSFAGGTVAYVLESVLGVFGSVISLVFMYGLFVELENSKEAVVVPEVATEAAATSI